MSNKEATSSPFGAFNPLLFSKMGQEQSQAAIDLQKEVFKAYEEAGRAWAMRAQSEAALWSELASKLTATRSVPEAVEAYTACVSKQMQMTAEDGQRLLKDWQQIGEKLSKSLPREWPARGGT